MAGRRGGSMAAAAIALALTMLGPARAPASHELDDQYACTFEVEGRFENESIPRILDAFNGEVASPPIKLAGTDSGIAGGPGCFQNDIDGGGANTGSFRSAIRVSAFGFGSYCLNYMLYTWDPEADTFSSFVMETPEGPIRMMWDTTIWGPTGTSYVYRGRDGHGDRIWGSGAVSVRSFDAAGNELGACALADVASIRVTGSLVLTALADNL